MAMYRVAVVPPNCSDASVFTSDSPNLSTRAVGTIISLLMSRLIVARLLCAKGVVSWCEIRAAVTIQVSHNRYRAYCTSTVLQYWRAPCLPFKAAGAMPLERSSGTRIIGIYGDIATLVAPPASQTHVPVVDQYKLVVSSERRKSFLPKNSRRTLLRRQQRLSSFFGLFSSHLQGISREANYASFPSPYTSHTLFSAFKVGVTLYQSLPPASLRLLLSYQKSSSV